MSLNIPQKIIDHSKKVTATILLDSFSDRQIDNLVGMSKRGSISGASTPQAIIALRLRKQYALPHVVRTYKMYYRMFLPTIESLSIMQDYVKRNQTRMLLAEPEWHPEDGTRYAWEEAANEQWDIDVANFLSHTAPTQLPNVLALVRPKRIKRGAHGFEIKVFNKGFLNMDFGSHPELDKYLADIKERRISTIDIDYLVK